MFNLPVENQDNFNIPQKKGKYSSLTGDTDYAFPTSPDLPDSDYPDITPHFLDKKFNLYDGIAQKRASKDDADVYGYLGTGFGQGREFDLTHDSKFPGIAEDGSPQYALLGGTKVNGSMLTHHLMGLGLGASGTDYSKFKLPRTITHPEAMISGLLAHQKGYEHESNSPITSINLMQQAVARQPRQVASDPRDFRNPNARRADVPADIYDDETGVKIGTFGKDTEGNPTFKTGTRLWNPIDEPNHGKAVDDTWKQVGKGIKKGAEYVGNYALDTYVRDDYNTLKDPKASFRDRAGAAANLLTIPAMLVEGAHPALKGNLGHPFKGMSPKRMNRVFTDKIAKPDEPITHAKRFEARGKAPFNQKGSYVNTETNMQYYLDKLGYGIYKDEKTHVDVKPHKKSNSAYIREEKGLDKKKII